jgi:hypothetical protein
MICNDGRHCPLIVPAVALETAKADPNAILMLRMLSATKTTANAMVIASPMPETRTSAKPRLN